MPIFQRSYEWRIDSVRQLLRDVADRRATAPDLPHFTGTFVLLDEPDQDGVDRLMVIDGQQRLLTLATGIALAEHRLKLDGSALFNEGVAFASRPKVQPAAVDDADFAAILRGEVPTTGGHLARAAQVNSEALSVGEAAHSESERARIMTVERGEGAMNGRDAAGPVLFGPGYAITW